MIKGEDHSENRRLINSQFIQASVLVGVSVVVNRYYVQGISHNIKHLIWGLHTVSEDLCYYSHGGKA